jgi:uncharacterized membrane protein YgcG
VPPPALEVLLPAAGTALRDADGPELALQFALDVALWCGGESGGVVGVHQGSFESVNASATAADEASWTCAKLSDLVVCLDAVSVPLPSAAGSDAAEVIARQWCLPWAAAALRHSTPMAHLPAGAFGLVARFVWAPFADTADHSLVTKSRYFSSGSSGNVSSSSSSNGSSSGSSSGGHAAAKWERASPPVVVTREAGWSDGKHQHVLH